MKKINYVFETEEEYNEAPYAFLCGVSFQSETLEFEDDYDFIDYLRDNCDDCDIEEIKENEFQVTNENGEKTYYIVF